MSIDIVDLEAFYASDLGRRVAEDICAIIHGSADAAQTFLSEKTGSEMSPSLKPALRFGIGFTRPFWGDALPTLMPARQGTMVGAGQSLLVDEHFLPIRDNQIDAVIGCHFLEHCADPLDALRELYRVIVPEGQLQLIVANRRGIWSRRERTPFGAGRPYSRGQLRRLMQQVGFVPVSWQSALYFLPGNRQIARMSAPVLDKVGRRLWPELAGVLILNCIKRVPAPVMKPRQYVRFAPPIIRPVVSRVKG